MIQPEILRELAAYADGEVADVLRPELERAVAGDPECQAAVARWKALRNCAQRALASEPVPGDLQVRIHQALAHQRRVSAFRWWGFSGLALATAALVLLVMLRPAPGGPERVYAAEFAQVYRDCGHSRRHNISAVTGRGAADVAREVRSWPETDFPVYFPNMSGAGYELAGVCRCFSPESGGVRALHASYVRGKFEPGGSSRPEDVVSFFSLSQRVEMAQQQPVWSQGRSIAHPQRQYFAARAADNISVVKWDEARTSVAACSAIPQEELMRLVDGAEVTAGPRTTEPPAAASSHAIGGAYAAAGVGVGAVGVLLRRKLAA